MFWAWGFGLDLVPPDLNRLVFTSTGDLLSIRTPVDSKHLILVSWKVHLELAGAQVPDLESGILR